MLMDADFRVQPMLAEAWEYLPETYPYLQLYGQRPDCAGDPMV
jgi:hypothetical protein